jgi:hypothetical protein
VHRMPQRDPNRRAPLRLLLVAAAGLAFPQAPLGVKPEDREKQAKGIF